MRRHVIPELLDDDQGTAAEIADSLVDLRAINERFGGTQATLKLVRKVAARCGCRELSLLDVAAGAGDVPLRVRQVLAGDGIDVRVTLVDRMPAHLQGNTLAAVCGDALRLPFRDSSFDVVSCSLFAHHLEPEEICAFAVEAARVCRCAVLINDLIRSPVHLALVYAALPLFRSRLTRHDALASVRRAYTVQEMETMLRGVSAEIEVSRHFLYRMGIVLWKGRSS